MSSSASKHHKAHSLTGLVTIISLPFVLAGLAGAVGRKSEGISAWISSPFGAISLLVFLTACIWYCKLEMDEVIIDYTDGGLLLLNKIFTFIVWAASAFAILSSWLG